MIYTHNDTHKKILIIYCHFSFRIVQKVINDTIKEHLFGPDLTSTDENSPHSPESGDEGMYKLMITLMSTIQVHGGHNNIFTQLSSLALFKFVALQLRHLLETDANLRMVLF